MKLIGFIMGLVVLTAGEIKPRSAHPVDLSYNNAEVLSNYTFKFQPETRLKEGMQVFIRFPTVEYESGLGIKECLAYEEEDPMTCRVDNTTVILDWKPRITTETGDTHSLTVSDVRNPNVPGVTGHFALEVWQGGNLLDYTDFFGQVGITPVYQPMEPLEIVCTGSCRTGDIDTFQLSFNPQVPIFPGVRFLLYVPSIFSPATCSSPQIPMLVCIPLRPGLLSLSGWEPRLSSNSKVILTFPTLRNPLEAGRFGTFRIVVLEKSLNTILTRTETVPGPTIFPNGLFVDLICPNLGSPVCLSSSHVTEKSPQIFQITGHTTNEIPPQGVLLVTFSSGFGPLFSATCSLYRVLAECEVDNSSKSVLFRMVSGLPKGQFTIEVMATTPSADAKETITMTSFADSGLRKVIDKTESVVSISLKLIRRLENLTILWSDNLTAGTVVDLSIVFRPHADFREMNQGRIRILLPKDTSITLIGAPTLDICRYSIIQTSLQSTWSPASGLLDIPLVPGPQLLPCSCESSVDVTAGGTHLILPPEPGVYPFEVILNDGVQDIEAYLDSIKVGPRLFNSGSILPFSSTYDAFTSYEISFVPSVPIPASGLIFIEFPTGPQLWKLDLGTGLPDHSKISCLGIVPMISKTLICHLAHGSNDGKAVISVENFNEMKAGMMVKMEIGGIRNPGVIGTQTVVTVSSMAKIKDKSVPLNSSAFPLLSSEQKQTWETPMEEVSLQISMVPNTISSPSSLQIPLILKKQLYQGTGNGLILLFPRDFGLPETGETCGINETYLVNCVSFPSGGLMVITEIPLNLAPETEYFLTIKNLVNPAHLLPPSNLTISAIIDHREIELFVYRDFPSLIPGQISATSVTADNSNSESPDSVYFFLFTVENLIVSTGKIRLFFPMEEYRLKESRLECSESGLVPIEGEGVKCQLSSKSHVLDITNFAQFQSHTITIKIAHVINPSTVGLTGQFGVETYSETGFLVDANYNIPGINISPKPDTSGLIHLSTVLSPNNIHVLGDLSVTFLPSSDLPKGSVISLLLPEADFPSLPSLGICGIAGGLRTMEFCRTEESKIRISIDSAYIRGLFPVPITISLKGLNTGSHSRTTGLFSLQIHYEGHLLDESLPDETNRKVTISGETHPLNLLSYDFSPKSASEEAVYVFVLQPKTDFLGNCTVRVKFGEEFPRRLSKAVSCFSPELSTLSNGKVDCFVQDRTVVVNGTRGWKGREDVNVTLYIRRVVNPEKSLGSIGLFTQCGETIQDYLLFTPNRTPSPTPSPLFLTNLTTTSSQMGLQSNLSLSAEASKAPISQDLILVDFPPQFVLDYSQESISCGAYLETSETNVPCDYELGRVSIVAFGDDYRGTNYSVSVANVENPWDIGEIPYPVLSIYSVDTDSIASKTVPNLSKVPPLSFTKTAFSIIVNDNHPWTQNKGTRSDFIFVTLETPAPAQFSISPKNAIPGVMVMPYSVEFQQGESRSKFQLNIGETARKGNYTLEWNVNGAWSRPTYAGVRRTGIVITDYGNEQVMVKSVQTVIQGGTSDLCTVMLQHAPATELILRLVKLGSQPTHLSFLPPELKFTAGESVKTFAIVVEEESYGDMGEFFIYKEGENANAFFLPKSVFSFYVNAKKDAPPRLIADLVTDVTRTSAVYRLTTDKPAVVTCMWAWFGTRNPTPVEMRTSNFSGPALSPVQFSTIRTPDSVTSRRYEYSLHLTGLCAQMRYVLYTQMTDERSGSSSMLHMTNFTTERNFKPAYTTLKFTEKIVSPGIKTALLDAVTQFLGVDHKRLSLLDENRLSSTLAEVKHEGKTYYHVVLDIDPYDAGETSPLQFLARLNSHKEALKKEVGVLDESVEIRALEVENETPKWKMQAKVEKVANRWARIVDLALEKPGVCYACLIQSLNPPVKPISYQIYMGVDFSNQPCLRNFSTHLSATPQVSSISGLTPNSTYWLFLTASNALFAYPDLLPDEDVLSLSFHTENYEGKTVTEDLNSGAILFLGLSYLLI